MKRSMVRRTGALLAMSIALGACVSRTVGSPADRPPEATVAPALVLEQFLRAANASDLDTLRRLFGTKDGPWAQYVTPAQADERMLLFSSVLKHDDYMLLGDAVVPGRRGEATQLNVRLTRGQSSVDVPFVMVWAGGLGWMVEEFGIEKLLNR